MSFLVIRLQKQAATAAGVSEIQNAVPLCNTQFGKPFEPGGGGRVVLSNLTPCLVSELPPESASTMTH